MILTVDDGPQKNIVDLARRCKEKGYNDTIFFCVGWRVYNMMGEVRALIEMGFEVQNHSYSHPNFETLNWRSAQMEILATEHLLEMAYSDCGIKRNRKLFRFPFGKRGKDKKGQFQKILSKLGFEKFDPDKEMIDLKWDFDALDYKDQFDIGRLSEIKEGDVVLMHDFTSRNGRAMEIIEALPTREIQIL